MLLPAVPVEECRSALHQLVIKPFILVAAAADGHAQRLLPCAGTGYHHFPLPQAPGAGPCRHLVRAVEHRVIAVTLPVGKGQLLHGGVGFLYHKPPVLGALGNRIQLRLCVHVILKSAVAQIRLVDLRRKIVDLAAVLSRGIGHIIADASGNQRLPLLPAHHPEHLGKLALSFRVHNPEDQRDGSPLPQAQLNPLRCQLSLVVVAVGFNKPDGILGQALLIIPALFLQPFDDHLIQHPDVPADNHTAVFNLLVVGQYGILIFHVFPQIFT